MFLRITVLALSNVASLSAEGIGSANFSERELAQENSVKLATSEPEHLEQFLHNYSESADPEERFRLKELLFQATRDIVPKNGTGFIGINMQEIADPKLEGIRIQRVIENTPAQRAGLKIGDVIQRVGEKKIRKTTELKSYVSQCRPGSELALEILRDGKKMEVPVKLMDGRALPQQQFSRIPSEIDPKRVEELLREDFGLWLEKKLKEIDEEPAVRR